MRAHSGQKSIPIFFFFFSLYGGSFNIFFDLVPNFYIKTVFIREPRIKFNHCLKASLYFLAWNQKSLSFKQMVK